MKLAGSLIATYTGPQFYVPGILPSQPTGSGSPQSNPEALPVIPKLFQYLMETYINKERVYNLVFSFYQSMTKQTHLSSLVSALVLQGNGHIHLLSIHNHSAVDSPVELGPHQFSQNISSRSHLEHQCQC